MADGAGSLALYQSEKSVSGYCLRLIILRVYRFSSLAPLVSRRASIDVPAPEGRAGADYGQNACITFSLTWPSRNNGGEHGASMR